MNGATYPVCRSVSFAVMEDMRTFSARKPLFRRAASTASPSPFYLKSKKLIKQKMRGPMPTATDVGRDMMGWSPECAKALLDNFLDAYHEIARESLKQALTEIPTGIHTLWPSA